MSLGRKVLMAAVLYALPASVAYVLGLLAGNIALVLVYGGILAFFAYLWSLFGLMWGVPSGLTEERKSLDPGVANRIQQMPSYQDDSLMETVAKMVGYYLLTIIVASITALIVS